MFPFSFTVHRHPWLTATIVDLLASCGEGALSPNLLDAGDDPLMTALFREPIKIGHGKAPVSARGHHHGYIAGVCPTAQCRLMHPQSLGSGFKAKPLFGLTRFFDHGRYMR
jgi:hypothetical protein